MAGPADYEKVVSHYGRAEVREEVARFSEGRWVALHCRVKDGSGRPYLLRYRKFRGRRFR